MRVSATWVTICILSACGGLRPAAAGELRFEAAGTEVRAYGAGYDLSLASDGLRIQGSRLVFEDANRNAQATPLDSSRIRYDGIYPGVDAVYYDRGGKLEFDLAVAPGADPGQIRFVVEGATTEAGMDGALRAWTAGGEIRFDAPVLYQEAANGARTAVAGRYVVEGGRVGFRTGDYDRSRTLIIDPVVNYSTYVGNSGDSIMAATADSSGNTYLVGRASGLILLEKVSPDGTTVLSRVTLGTTSYSFSVYDIALGPSGKVYIAGNAGIGLPTTANAYQTSVTSGLHVFLAVLDASFNLTYCSYITGTTNASEQANGIAADAAGNAYITGFTSSTTYPVTAGVVQSTPGSSGSSGFVSKINPGLSGTGSLVYSTYLGGATTVTNELAIAVDASNNAYVTGTAGSDFPTTASALKYNGAGLGLGGVYVTKLNATASSLTYSAYLGPGQANGLALDGSGNAYLTGSATISDFPTTAGAYQANFPGAFAAELNTTGTSLIYSTFLAGPSSATNPATSVPGDIALAPGCASACSAYIAGYTSTIDFPVVNPVQNFNASAPVSGNDAFVVVLSGNGTAASYSTYLGGSQDESNNGFIHVPGIGVMSTGDALVAGQTSSTDFPVTLTTTPSRSVFAARISGTAGSKGVASPASLTFASQIVSVPSPPQPVALRNLGNSALSIASIAAAGDYSQSNTCGTSVAGGGSCAINVVFTPTSNSNPRAGTVTINGSIVVNLTGTGTNGAYMNLAPASLTFASTPVGSAAPSQTVLLSNAGNQALTIGTSGFSVSGDFAQTNNCPASLASNSNCTVTVSFLPTQVGQRTGSVFISTNSSSANNTITLAGTGAAGSAALTVGGSGLVFNPQTVNVPSTGQSMIVTNTGNVPATIFSALASGDYSTTGCIQTLNPGATCSVRVTFTPTAAGSRTGTVTIVDSTAASPHTFTLTGTGVAAATTITLTPSSLVFADQAVGQTTARALQITATNTGTTPVTFDRIVESGDFRITTTTCSTLSFRTPPSTCTVSVVFTPTVTGARTGSIVFTDTATGSPQTVSLSGNGLAVTTTATVSPLTLAFGTQPVGLPSTTQNTTWTNTGNVPINLTSATITGANAGDFSQSNFCVPSTLTPTRTCSFTITFTPTGTGSRSATLSIVGDAGTQNVSLTGTGSAASASLGFSPTAMTFQAQATGTTSPTQNLIVANNGNEPITISNIQISGNFAIPSDPCVTTIQPNISCTIQVNYTPTGATGTQIGTITFTDNAGTGTQTVNLTGQNVATGPAIKLQPSGLAFSMLAVGTTSSSQFVSLTNTSGATVTGLSVGNPVPATDFTIVTGTNSCGTSLTAGAGCNFQVSFTPTATGNRTATITIANSAASQTLSLAGFGQVSNPSAFVKDPSLVFPDQVVATTSNSQNVTLTNNGDVPLTITNVTVSAGDYAISNNCPASPNTLNAGTSCTIGASFTPSAAGNRTGTVTISDSAPGSPRTVSLSGKGLTAAQGLEIDRKTLVFPTESVGSTANQPNPQTVTLTNTGNSPVTISSITSSSTAFVLTNGCPMSPSTLPPGPNGNTCTVQVTFTPAKGGAASGTMTITSSAPGTAPKVTMSGTGVADTKTVAITPASLTFSQQVVGTTSATQTVTVTNTGNFNITMTNATVSTGYSLSNGCNNVTLTPATTCSISVSFTPTQAKVLTGTLTITDTASPSTQKVTLTGTGITSSSEISLSQTSMVFDQQVVGVASQPQAVYYFNQSNATVNFTNVVLNGGDYSMINGCTGSVTAFSSCNIKVTFKPTATGIRTGSIVITDSAPGSPRTINLSGTGVSAPSPGVLLTPTSLTFGSQSVGTSSAPQNVNLTNSGEANLTITGITVTGANAGDYSQTNNCPATLTASFSCIITVTFKPTVTGARAASISVADNVTPSPQTVALTGTGTPGTTPSVTFTPPSLTFNNVPINTTSASQSSQLKNTGAASLTISSIVASGTVAGDFAQTNNCPATVAVNGTCTITVTFTPTSVIDQTGAVTVTDNTPNGSDALALAGNGAAPAVNLSTTTLAFGNQTHGTTSQPKTVTVENAGNLPLTINTITATSDYHIVNNTCPASLGPGLTCTFGVTFSPSITGADNGYAMIADNAGDSPQFITLTGTGI